MAKVDAGARSIIRASYAVAIVAALAIGGLAVFYGRQSVEVRRQEFRADVLATLGMLRSQIQGALDGKIQLVQGLGGIVEFEPDMTPAEFERLAERLMRGRTGIRALAAAPDLVITMVYPPAAAAILGRSPLGSPRARASALMARALGTTTLTGPIDLVGGGRGFIARTPVFIDAPGEGRHFWGLVSMAMEAEALFQAGGLLDPNLAIDVAVVARDGPEARPEVIFGDDTVPDRDPVTTEVALPIGEWTLAAVPSAGWAAPDLGMQRLLFALAGLLVVVPILATARFVASRQGRLAEIRDREEELSRLSWRLEFALAASNIGVWDVDLATDHLLWDARSRALFDLPDRDGYFSESDWLGAIHPDDRARALAEAREAAAGRGKFVSRYRIVRPNGEVRHIRDMAGHYVDADGARRLVGLMWDDTVEVAREEELDLRRREAEAATDAKSRFLAAMSHEIRTPMTGVLGLLGLMLNEPLPARQRERATIALASAENLLEILNDILDFSKLEAGQIRIVNESFAPRPLVAEIIDLMTPNAAKKGLALTATVSDVVPERVEADPVRLRQVLTNLISNATKFTDAGEVAVTVGYDPEGAGGMLEVAVEDTGIGIAPEQQERIFEQFVQADTSLTRRAGGTGLGLAICRQLVEGMGGAMTLRSVPGMGSTFRFAVPAREVGEDRRPAVVPEPAAETAGGPMRILLAEDNPTNQYLINAYLRAAGHAVEVVSNGIEAVAAAAGGGFDAILMDVQMPETDGLAATRQIRAMAGPAGQVPIVALTANAMTRDRDACLEAGMTDYLAKPIDVAALHRALARARASAAEPEPQRSAGAA